MEVNSDLLNELKKYKVFKENKVIYDEINNLDISFDQLENKLLGVGMILSDNVDLGRLVIKIQSGLAKKIPTYASIILHDHTVFIAAYSDEGIISQHSSEKSIKTIKERILEKRGQKNEME